MDILHLDGRLTIAAGHGWAQTPQVVTLNIEWENAVVYIDDVADPSNFVTSSTATTPNIRNDAE